jgi:hypothetical protein
MITTRKMVESSVATPRPDHDVVEPSGVPTKVETEGALFRGELLLLLCSRYLTPGHMRFVAPRPVTVAGPCRLHTGFPLGPLMLAGPDCRSTILAAQTVAPMAPTVQIWCS